MYSLRHITSIIIVLSGTFYKWKTAYKSLFFFAAKKALEGAWMILLAYIDNTSYCLSNIYIADGIVWASSRPIFVNCGNLEKK